MKQNIFLILIMLLSCFSCNAQQRDTLFYSSPEEAAKGFRKTPTRYRGPDKIKRPVVVDAAGFAYAIYGTCERGFFREPLTPEVVAVAN